MYKLIADATWQYAGNCFECEHQLKAVELSEGMKCSRCPKVEKQLWSCTHFSIGHLYCKVCKEYYEAVRKEKQKRDKEEIERLEKERLKKEEELAKKKKEEEVKETTEGHTTVIPTYQQSKVDVDIENVGNND